MFTQRVAPILAGLLIVASLAACAPVPAATTQPVATTAPTATAEPTATTTPAATPTPAIPDPKTDPAAALLHAGRADLFKTGEFTYTMTMTMAPADEASRAALGDQAAELESATVDMQGSGAMDMTDPDNARLRMEMVMDIGGEQVDVSVIAIGPTAWIKAPGQDEWMKLEGDQAASIAPSGLSPEQMIEYFENAVDVEWIEDVSRDGQELSHLRFTVDPSQMDLKDLLTGNPVSESLSTEDLEAMVKDMKPVVDVWLTRSALELREQQFTVDWVMGLPEEANTNDAKLRIVMTMRARYSNVNEPVTIEAPAE